nr:hypothetical protein [Tanacetum cinerariifolium]
MTTEPNYTFPSAEGRLRSVSAVVCELVTVFVPLDGADEGVGSFFGSICSQLTSFGNLDVASDRARKVIMLNNKILCLHAPNMMYDCITQDAQRTVCLLDHMKITVCF